MESPRLLQGLTCRVPAIPSLTIMNCPACSKSVFAWSAEPGDGGAASLIVHLCKVGEDRCVNLVNEFGMDLAEPLQGETLEALSGGIYFLAIDNTSGRPWSIHWECRD